MKGSAAGATSDRPFVPPPAPRTAKSAGTRRLLIGVAARLFTERGYTAVSMRDIASEAGLTKGALYGHFRSKGQLLVEVIRTQIAEAEEAMDFSEVLANPEMGVALMFDVAGRQTRLLEVDAAAAARHDPDVAAGLVEFYMERQASIRKAASNAPDPEIAAWIVSVLTAGIGMRESAGMSLPLPERLRPALLATLQGVF